MNVLAAIQDPTAFAASEFGIPSCVLDLAASLLNLIPIPTEALLAMMIAIQEAMAVAYAFLDELLQMLWSKLGLKEINSILGAMQVFMDISLLTLALGLAAIQAFGQLYQSIADQIESIKNCLESFRKDQMLKRGLDPNDPSGRTPISGMFPDTGTKLLVERSVQSVEDFQNRARTALDNINTVLSQRAAVGEPDAETPEEEGAIFRLVYGPPKAKKGQFLLSEDGLYYDSQTRLYDNTKEIPDEQSIINFHNLEIPIHERWKSERAPSLGGKGTSITINDLDRYFDTILDITQIDSSVSLTRHYTGDATLQVIEGQKMKVLTDMEDHKKCLIASGYEEDSAIVSNYQQQIFSELQSFDNKIRKRKKQIELGVKAPQLYGVSSMFGVGEVPVNDFSYLGKFNIAIDVEKQRKLSLDHGEVSGVILPVKPIYVRYKDADTAAKVLPLKMTRIGTGALVDSPDPSSTLLPALPITDSVITDNLIACYSFLDARIKTTDSSAYSVYNSTGDSSQNAQIVGKTTSKVFNKGLAIPRLDGIMRYRYVDSSNFIKPLSVGSYVKLPATKEFNNLLYTKNGTSIDTWLHIPGFGTGQNDLEAGRSARPTLEASGDNYGAWTDYHYYKVLLSNENIGGDFSANPNRMYANYSSDTVRGLMIALTRDPQWTMDNAADRGLDTDIASEFGSLDTADTILKSSLIIAPTQSLNGSDVEFLRQGDCSDEGTPLIGFTVDTSTTTQSGYSINDCSSEFVHLSITMNPEMDDISVYLNGEVLKSASYSKTFELTKKSSLRIPTFKVTNEKPNESFTYNKKTIDINYTLDFVDGPDNDVFFTPWIVGGGWTDGLPITAATRKGGFMGESRGFYSGLGGHVGSLKFYKKPLTQSEVKHNYESHRVFFTNIDTCLD